MIKIAERLHPFSHQPGTHLMLPGSQHSLQIFPTLLRLYDHHTLIGEVTFSLTGPVRDFTIIQDLERLEVRVFGHTREGYFRYVCKKGAPLSLQMVKGNLALKTNLSLGESLPLQVPAERLSLGSHKAQDWMLMQRRLLLEELLPLWFRLGMITPAPTTKVGEDDLLGVCRKAIEERRTEAIGPAFLNLFLAGFSGLFVPQLEDALHQGFTLPPLRSHSQLFLLTEGARLIRSLFIQQEGNRIALLPALPAEFHSGRMVGIECPPFGQIDMEWSKKELRRLILRATSDGEISFVFRPELKEFRLGKNFIPCGTPLIIQKGKEYQLDNFRH